MTHTRSVTVAFVVVIFGVIVLLVAGLLRPAAAPASAPVVGHPAPAFTLPAADKSRTVSLSDYRGHPVLLNFFATWCVPCTHEMPQIEGEYRAASGKLAVLGVDKQEPSGDVKSMGRQFGISYPLLLDDNLTVWQRYRVSLQPVSYWIDGKGVIRAIHYGPMDISYMKRELARLQA